MLTVNKTKITKKRCEIIGRANTMCGRFAINNTDYCDRHKHMNEYTKEMLTNVSRCATCHVMRYIKEGYVQDV